MANNNRDMSEVKAQLEVLYAELAEINAQKKGYAGNDTAVGNVQPVERIIEEDRGGAVAKNGGDGDDAEEGNVDDAEEGTADDEDDEDAEDEDDENRDEDGGEADEDDDSETDHGGH
ncbi:nonsense-mediated mRNA decay protein 2-like [Chenopodium quinoa]|uniref:nonsense-mediated mRNA decay protein 2-like n=1 Tax=Chenopodium quinoa TaxID=63459 RepID=UPI000B77680D|nr:nonsense-mediated mRNA decay protein 2-like [Chenopodium quinoa]